MDKRDSEENQSTSQNTNSTVVESGDSACGCSSSSCCETTTGATDDQHAFQEGIEQSQGDRKVLNIDLLAIDLEICQRCVPTGGQLRDAITLLSPVADALGIELRHREIVAQTPEEAKEHALLSSPTIRLNGRDVAQDIRESLCESCGDLTGNNTAVDCREWHYRGQVYHAAPLPLLIEAIMEAMLNIDTPPSTPAPLAELPENLQRYFSDKKQPSSCC